MAKYYALVQQNCAFGNNALRQKLLEATALFMGVYLIVHLIIGQTVHFSVPYRTSQSVQHALNHLLIASGMANISIYAYSIDVILIYTAHYTQGVLKSTSADSDLATAGT